MPQLIFRAVRLRLLEEPTPAGNIVGIYTDASGTGHGFLFNGAYTSFDYPGAAFTEATGINPGGVIVGLYTDSAGATHGFIRTP